MMYNLILCLRGSLLKSIKFLYIENADLTLKGVLPKILQKAYHTVRELCHHLVTYV